MLGHMEGTACPPPLRWPRHALGFLLLRAGCLGPSVCSGLVLSQPRQGMALGSRGLVGASGGNVSLTLSSCLLTFGFAQPGCCSPGLSACHTPKG